MPSVRAEKYIHETLAVDEKTLPMATITGRTDRQTDRQSATQYAAPPREEGRIIRTVLASDRHDLTVSNLIIDSVRAWRSDAYLML